MLLIGQKVPGIEGVYLQERAVRSAAGRAGACDVTRSQSRVRWLVRCPRIHRNEYSPSGTSTVEMLLGAERRPRPPFDPVHPVVALLESDLQ